MTFQEIAKKVEILQKHYNQAEGEWGEIVAQRDRGETELEQEYKTFELEVAQKIIKDLLREENNRNLFKDMMQAEAINTDGKKASEIIEEFVAMKGSQILISFIEEFKKEIQGLTIENTQLSDFEESNPFIGQDTAELGEGYDEAQMIEEEADMENAEMLKKENIIFDNIKIYSEDSYETRQNKEIESIGVFMKDNVDNEALKGLRKRWGEGEDKNKDLDFKAILANEMLREEYMFPSNWESNDEIKDLKFDIASFKKFKSAILQKRVDLQLSKKKSFSNYAITVIQQEIKFINEIEGSEKNILDYMYESNFKENETEYKRNKNDSFQYYEIIMPQIKEEIKEGDTKEKINWIVEQHFKNNPNEYKRVVNEIKNTEARTKYQNGLKTNKEVVKEYIDRELLDKKDMYHEEKKDVITAMRRLTDEELTELKIRKDSVENITKENVKSSKKGINALEIYAINEKEEELQNIDFKKLMNNKEEFDKVYREYGVINEVMANSGQPNKQKSFFVDLQRSETNNLEDIVIKSLAFINKNFKDVLEDKKYEELVNKVKNGYIFEKGVGFSFLAELEKDVLENFVRIKRSGPMVNMAKKNFVEMEEYNEELLQKNALEIDSDFSKINLDKRHFVTHMITMMGKKDGEEFFEKAGIKDEKIKEEFTKYYKSIKEGEIKDTQVDQFVNVFLSCKAESENLDTLADITENFETAGKEEKVSELIKISKNYPLIKKRSNKTQANIVEDYLKNVQANEKREIIKQMLIFMNIKDIDAALIGIEYDKEPGHYNDKITTLINDYMGESEDNLEKLMGFLSREQSPEQQQQEAKKPAKRYTFTELANIVSQEKTKEINEYKAVEIDNERQYNVRGLSLINHDPIVFQMGYNVVLRKYQEGMFKNNEELNELIGLRLAMSRQTEDFGEIDIDGVQIESFVPQDGETISQLIEKDVKLKEEIKKSFEEGLVEGEKREYTKEAKIETFNKLLTTNMGEQKYKKIILELYEMKKDKFLRTNRNYLNKVNEQSNLKHELKTLQNEKAEIKTIEKVNNKIQNKAEKINENYFKGENVKNINEEIIQEIINIKLGNRKSDELTEEESIEIAAMVGKLEKSVKEVNESEDEVSQEGLIESIKEVIGEKIDTIEINELISSFKKGKKAEYKPKDRSGPSA